MDKEKFRTFQKEIVQLREQLNKSYQEKEAVFTLKKNINQQVITVNEQIVGLKNERNALTGQVKELKQKREQLHNRRKEKNREKKDIYRKQQELLKTYHLKDNPEKVKFRIAQLEVKLETEAMPFSKEQKIQKEIKDLRRKYCDVKKFADQWKNLVSQLKKISDVSSKAEKTHRDVQEKAQESQQKHEKLSSLLEKIKSLRADERKKEEEFLSQRIAYENIRKELHEKVTELKNMARQVKEKDQRQVSRLLEEKTTKLREKMKKRKKLTTEDLLTFQAIDER